MKRSNKIALPARRAGIAALPAAAAIGILFLLNLFIFRDHWRGLATFPWDFPAAYYAFTGYWITSMQLGEWPHWIPYQSLGYPSALNPQLDLFYFPFWIFVVFRIPYTLHAATVLQVLHVLFGSVGFLLFVWRCFRSNGIALCGAVVFTFFGGFYTNAEHADVIRAFSWVPWLFWALLLDEELMDRRVARWHIRTRFRGPNVFLPLIVCFFVTGAYPGSFIAGLFIAAVFILAQAGALAWRFRDRFSWYDGAAQCGQLILALGMALLFLLPAAYMSRELVRAQEFHSLVRRYLTIPDLYHLFLPSNFLAVGADFSMEGMQLPILLLLLIPLVRIRATLLIPVLTAASLSAVMCLKELIPASLVVTALLPPLRLSRFPGGDFRIYIYIAILVCALSGLQQLLKTKLNLWRNSLKIAAAGFVLGMVYLYRITHPAPNLDEPYIYAWMLRDGINSVALLVGFGILWRTNWLRSAGAYVMAIACAYTMLPVISQMKVAWNDPQAETNLYSTPGLTLMGNDNRLRVEQVFKRQESQRPLRSTNEILNWEGYLNGSYQSTIKVGSFSISQQRLLVDSSLHNFVMGPGAVVQVACTTAICDSPEVGAVSLPGQASAGTTLQYSRNYVVYKVSLARRSLVIENELYAPGWSGICEIHHEHFDVHRVDGGFRGWVLNAGEHRLRVKYRTPWLTVSAIFSMLFVVCWISMTVIWFRSKPEDPANS